MYSYRAKCQGHPENVGTAILQGAMVEMGHGESPTKDGGVKSRLREELGDPVITAMEPKVPVSPGSQGDPRPIDEAPTAVTNGHEALTGSSPFSKPLAAPPPRITSI